MVTKVVTLHPDYVRNVPLLDTGTSWVSKHDLLLSRSKRPVLHHPFRPPHPEEKYSGSGPTGHPVPSSVRNSRYRCFDVPVTSTTTEGVWTTRRRPTHSTPITMTRGFPGLRVSCLPLSVSRLSLSLLTLPLIPTIPRSVCRSLCVRICLCLRPLSTCVRWDCVPPYTPHLRCLSESISL